MTATTKTRRGTVHANERGSAEDRRRRRAWIMVHFADPFGFVRCYLCRMILINEGPSDAPDYMTVDRIIPGCEGGRYIRSNIRPACGRCNSETGGALANRRALTLAV